MLVFLGMEIDGRWGLRKGELGRGVFVCFLFIIYRGYLEVFFFYSLSHCGALLEDCLLFVEQTFWFNWFREERKGTR